MGRFILIVILLVALAFIINEAMKKPATNEAKPKPTTEGDAHATEALDAPPALAVPGEASP